MPTTPTDPGSHRWPLVGLLLAALLLGGCSDEIPEPDQGPRDGTRGGAKLPEARNVVPALTHTLRRRADAVLHEDRAAFLSGIDRRQPGFVAEQTWYADNLAQLPIESFSYTLEPSSLVREGRGYWAEVVVSLQLRPYDAAPVVTRDRYLFAPGRGSRYLLASVTDPVWEEDQRDLDPQPWDTGPVTIREGAGVLGIFDAGSASRAAGLVDEAERAAAAVSAEVPYGWDRSVVVYALSSPAFLAGLDDVPGDDPLRLDAVTFEVPAVDGDQVADTRVVLNPRILGVPTRGRSRLLRHELTHVAVGGRADGVPTWLSEGLAEYVSVRSIPPQQRRISGAALAAAEDGLTEMPPDSEFGGDTAEASYGVAWWACEYLARATGEAVLWDLLDALRGADADAVLRDNLRLSTAELARRAGRLMLDTYRPEPDKKEKPDDEPSASP